MFAPQRGLSAELLAWPTLNEILLGEPRLNDLRLLMEAKEFELATAKLYVIKDIFSSKPPEQLSSQTRIAAIALLCHLMYVPPVRRYTRWREGQPSEGFQQTAFTIFHSLCTDDRFWTLEHEKELWRKILKDSESHFGGQIPIRG
ncbi:hypothetical protein PCANC_21280 [Puccinia coronata f. sp. avenae]|uniref:Uncharacterized protein n=1 Tax=Puccinia coronata f. sp. avenae TaxID=200324 RepID=A0A2N5SDZ0_9BASI|nr:hypothetical protein PCANC_21280 [Puccinia coronata f. sp. avenae]